MFLSNTTLLMVFILGPIIYALLLNSVYKSGKVVELPVVVVDRDNSPMSLQIIEMLNDNESMRIVRVVSETNDARNEMIEYRAAALIVIPDRFEANVLTGSYPEVMIYCNTVNLLTANYVSKGIQQTLGTFAAGAEMKGLQRKGMSGAQAYTRYEPFKQNYVKVFNETGNYFTFMWPAMLTVVLQQVILLAMAVSIAYEVEKHTFGLGIVSKTRSAFVTLLVKVAPIWVLSIPIVLIFYCFHIFYHAPIPNSIFNFAIITGLFVMAASLFGAAVSAIIPNALKATQILMLLSAPGFIIGGYTWPMESMTPIVRFIADMLPLTPFLNAFKMLLFEQATLKQVVPSIIHLTLQVIVYFIIGFICVKWRIIREERKIIKSKLIVESQL